MTASSDRPPERLREAFLFGYDEPTPQLAAHVVRRALVGRAEWRRAAGARRMRRLRLSLAVALAVLVVVMVLVERLGAGVPRPPAEPGAIQPTPQASGASVVYVSADDPTRLRTIGYDGLPMVGSWPLPVSGSTSGIVSVSPDGAYVVTLDLQRSVFAVADAFGQVAATVPSTPGSPELGVWSADGGYLCQLAVADPLEWRLLVTAVPSSRLGADAHRLPGLPYPPYITVAACDPGARRAVLVEPLTDAIPAPRTAKREALVVDLTTGEVARRVSLGDSTHGTVFSPDARYVARVDYDVGTTSIIDLDTGQTVQVRRSEVRGFSGDDSRIVENVGETTRVVERRSGRVRYSQRGRTSTVRSGPGGADLALNVLRPGSAAGARDLVMVPAAGAVTFIPNATLP